jgi:2-oxoglutarate dehydrogenase E1 component
MSKTNYQEFLNSSQLAGGNFDYLEQLFEDYLRDPNSVSSEWQAYFNKLPDTGEQDVSYAAVRNYFTKLATQPAKTSVNDADAMYVQKQEDVIDLINHYRSLGHRQANIDPLGLMKKPNIAELQLRNNGLSESDLTTIFSSGSFAGLKRAPLTEIIDALQKTYCGSIGAEFMHITDSVQRNWLLERFESAFGCPDFSSETKLRILSSLVAAEGFERYLHTKYVGQKRFSLEGGDTLIPLLDYLSSLSAAHDVEEILIGMAHRGRLNVLVNIMGQAPQELFDQFEGKHQDEISGDVKYHLGFSSDVKTVHGAIHLSLAFNPSHLEIVSPVVEGAARAKQDRRNQNGMQSILPVLIHGDASFAGQGVVMETLNLSQVDGYKTGGTVHIVVNNQIGFTTDPQDDRSTLYCTDVAKMVEAPIFHVNGDDPEAALFAMQLALEFRMHFNKDVVIDLVCYRRHGHNEADEPSATQPLIYDVIKNLPTTWQQYVKHLIAQGIITEDQANEQMKEFQKRLAEGNPVVELTEHKQNACNVDWAPYLNQKLADKVKTGIAETELKKLAKAVTTLPEKYQLHSRIEKIMQARISMANGETPVDWGFAETLAYASLLNEQHNVRISGQDAQRGTFFHRHAVLHNPKTGEKYLPLQHIGVGQGKFDVYNSILSEEAVMGYDMGYAMAAPNDLVIWEAQFGDFANGAQVIVDQFLSSMEQKWGRYCGLALLLPHGQEGQGPEHSSARLERYLQLCAQNNMQVCQPTTPAQIFHMIRRQVVRKARKPLIVMTPKSLLRHKLVVSTLDDLVQGEFQLLIPEVDTLKKTDVKRVIVCSGKVYYDLLQKRRDNNQTDTAIIRIEQLYPFPYAELTVELASYKNAQQVVWCQEEPKNQGAWYSIRHRLEQSLAKNQVLNYIGRDASAAPACGYLNTFIKVQEKLINQALTNEES